MRAPPPRSQTGTNDGDAAFAAVLHGQLRSRSGSLFYSPVSVRMAMTMLWAGARGETASEMQKALSLPAGDAAHAAFAKLLADWETSVVLHLVNGLWTQAGHHLRGEFVKLVRDNYRSTLGALDFHRAADTRAEINKWVADATEQKIRELIAPGLLATETRMVLINAVHLKAPWSEQFLRRSTREAPFFTDNGLEARVPLMRRVDFYSLGRLDGALLLELPYGDGRLAMDVVLPSAHDGLAPIEETYTRGGLPQWLRGLQRTRVDVMLPRFRTSSCFELRDALSALGMPSAFRPGADFSGIDGTHTLFIGGVLHQAFVDVDENGTEAAAETRVGLVMTARERWREAPVVFRADHPFLFFIRDTRADIVLFAGRLVDPTR